MIYEILALARRGSTKTRIVHSANLNFRLAERYLTFLLEKQLLTTQALNETKLYKLTERGEHMLLYLSEVEKELTELPTIQTRRTPSATLSVRNEPATIDPRTGVQPVRVLIGNRKTS